MTTDELRAKFENWWLRNGDPFDLHKVTARETWQAAHASRDAEVEAMRKDAERYRWLVENCSSNGGLGVEIFIGDDAPDAIDLAAAIDDAMREESK